MDKKHTRSLSGGRGNTGSQSSEELTIASPAEFVQRFGGNRVIEKVCKYTPQAHCSVPSHFVNCEFVHFLLQNESFFIHNMCDVLLL